jgi:uroporphyrinogen-III synthase
LLVSSGEALANLWRWLPKPDRSRLLARPCVASSARLAGETRALGFRDTLVAGTATPAGMIATLAFHAGARRFR